MLTLIRNLVAHKGDTTDVMVKEVLSSDPAIADREILALCDHILVSNRFWSAAIRGVDVVFLIGLPIVPEPRPPTGDSWRRAETPPSGS
jgi:hypothetical protein